MKELCNVTRLNMADDGLDQSKSRVKTLSPILNRVKTSSSEIQWLRCSHMNIEMVPLKGWSVEKRCFLNQLYLHSDRCGLTMDSLFASTQSNMKVYTHTDNPNPSNMLFISPSIICMLEISDCKVPCLRKKHTAIDWVMSYIPFNAPCGTSYMRHVFQWSMRVWYHSPWSIVQTEWMLGGPNWWFVYEPAANVTFQ